MFSIIDEDITLVLDNLPVGIIRMNESGKCVYTNMYIKKMLNIKDASGVCDAYMSAIHKDDMQCELDICRNFLHNYTESSNVVRIYNNLQKDYRWYMNKRTIIRSREGILTFMNTLQDVHENKLMELKLRDETLKAEKAYNHKTIFLANMSHEIRTPLNGIIGMLTLLEDTPLTNDQGDYISMLKECSYNLMTIINDILDFSKLEVGKITLDIKDMNLQECLESTNDIIMSKIYEKSLEFTSNIANDVPLYIKSDINRIKQVLLNLLSNSIKFTDDGNIILNVEKINYNTARKLYSMNKKEIPPYNDKYVYVRFDIEDTGCGIDKDDVSKLFKSFSQVDNQSTSKVYQGTGLGLAISKELVELMNGCIWLQWSEREKGSHFSFIIRVGICQEDVSTESDENDECLKNAHVLIVDDNMHNRLSLSGIVSKWGMIPHIFSNGEEALYFSKVHTFHIGLIDICMPKMDGHTLAAKFREQSDTKNANIPLIALSSFGEKISKTNNHFSAHIVKPIKELKLKKECMQLLSSDKFTSLSKGDIVSFEIDNNLDELKENIRILVAEDIYINQRVIVSFLNKSGFKNVLIVENGQQCIEAVLNKQFDVILLDIRMPVKNGDTVMKEISQFYSGESLNNLTKPYVVAVTAYGMEEDKEKYLSMGFDNYIPKPVSKSQLDKCMNMYIQKMLHE